MCIFFLTYLFCLGKYTSTFGSQQQYAYYHEDDENTFKQVKTLLYTSRDYIHSILHCQQMNYRHMIYPLLWRVVPQVR